MRLLIVVLLVSYQLKGQTDSSTDRIIFFDDFNDNKNNWTITSNKDEGGKIENGFYYLTAFHHAYGESQPVKIDTRRDFEIEARIKIADGISDHKNYYSMLFWGRQNMDSYYFTFAKDSFSSVEKCSGKNQSSCTVQQGSLQKSKLNPDAFNIYTIRKLGRSYIFLINGNVFYEMPFVPFFGDLIGIGAGRKTTLEIDYLKAAYL